jgi:DNA-binding NtrC family response regulator/PAS domain-containing protein
MNERDETIEKLKKELELLKEKVATYEEANSKRTACLSAFRKTWQELLEYSPLTDGLWVWNLSSGKVVFKTLVCGYQPGYSFVEWEIQHDGKWDEIVHPKFLKTVMRRLEGFIDRSGREESWVCFRKRNEPDISIWLERVGVNYSKDGTPVHVLGHYGDDTILDRFRIKKEELRGAEELYEAISMSYDVSLRVFWPRIRELLKVRREYTRHSDFMAVRFRGLWRWLDFCMEFQTHESATFLKDSGMKYVWVSSAMCSLLQLPISEILGKTDAELFGEEYTAYQEIELEGSTRPTFAREINIPGSGWVKFYMHVVYGPVSSVYYGIARRVANDSTDSQSHVKSPASQEFLNKVKQVAKVNTTLLLTGESGAGKDYWARHIHKNSHLAAGPFRQINCPGIPKHLAESELFGHEKGAFTGAVSGKRGLLEQANGGTLFLNEIGELSLEVQAKLLIFLDSQSFTRVGGTSEVHASVRIIAATKRNLSKLVKEGLFREDLFHRLNVAHIRVPSLKERPEEIPILLEYFLQRYKEELGKPEFFPDPESVKEMIDYDWPGNVRELSNITQRSLIFAEKPQFRYALPRADTEDAIQTQSQRRFLPNPTEEATLAEPCALSTGTLENVTRSYNDRVSDYKRSLISDALFKSRGNKKEAARLLGLGRTALYRQMETLGMDVSKRDT